VIQTRCGVHLCLAQAVHPKSLFQTALFSATPAKQGMAVAKLRVFTLIDG